MSVAPTAVVLLSGGLDSATVLAIAREQGFQIAAISFHYGQRHDEELLAAEALAQAAGVDRHVIAELNLRVYGESARTDDIAVPKGRDLGASEIPVT